MHALTISGDESASPMPSRPLSVRTRTRTESWLLAVFASTLGMRRIWQMISVILMDTPKPRDEHSDSRGFSPLHHRIPQHAQPLDLHFRHVAAFHEQRRLPREADAGRRPRVNQIARLKREHFRQIREQLADAEDELVRVAVLHRLAVEP